MTTSTTPDALLAALAPLPALGVNVIDATSFSVRWATSTDPDTLEWSDETVAAVLAAMGLSAETHSLHQTASEVLDGIPLETVEARSNVRFSITDGPLTSDFDGRSRGWQSSLVLDPEERRVYEFSRIGSGTPMRVWHNRSLSVGVSEAASGESIRTILEENVGLIEAIFATYEGTKWDGSNHIGQWAEGADGLPAYEQHLTALQEKLGGVACYQSAGEWLGQAWSESRNEVADALDAVDGEDRDVVLDRLAASWVDIAKSDGVLVDKGDVRKQIDRMVEQLDEEASDDEGDDGQPDSLQERQDFAHDDEF